MPFHLALFDASSPKIKRELMDTIILWENTSVSRFLNELCKRWTTWHWSRSSSQFLFPSKILLARWSTKLKGKLLKCLERLSVLSCSPKWNQTTLLIILKSKVYLAFLIKLRRSGASRFTFLKKKSEFEKSLGFIFFLNWYNQLRTAEAWLAKVLLSSKLQVRCAGIVPEQLQAVTAQCRIFQFSILLAGIKANHGRERNEHGTLERKKIINKNTPAE